MNNQFATQFLREDADEFSAYLDSADQLVASLRPTIEKGLAAGMSKEEILDIIDQILRLNEDGVAGGSTTGGGTTAGASFTPGAGEQMATTKAFKGTRKQKYQETTEERSHKFKVGDKVKYKGQDCEIVKLLDWGYQIKGPHFTSNVIKAAIERENPAVLEDAPRLAGSPAKTTKQGAKNLSAYSSVGFTKAPSAEEAGKKMKSIDVKMLWKEGEQEIEVRWSDIEDHTKKLGRKLHGFKPDSSEELYFLDYMKDAFKEGLITSTQSLLTTASNYSELTKEELNESRAYSKFKKETSIRSESERMHEAAKMINKRLEEISKLLEFTRQMREELSEGDDTLEYKHNTKKVFEKINKKVIEVYSKTKKLG